jgi:hypothetical protein
MGNKAYNAFNETLGLTQTVSQKQQVLQNVIAGKSEVKDLANLFPGLDVDTIQKQLFTPKQVKQVYGTVQTADGMTYDQFVKSGAMPIFGKEYADQVWNSKTKTPRDLTRYVADPNFQAPDANTLQQAITNQSLAKGQLDPFDNRSPLEKYQATAQFDLSQEQVKSAQNVLARKAAGTGMLASGNFAKALAEEGVRLGNEGFINYQNQLLNSAGQGLQAQGQYQQVAQGYNNSLASLYRQQGVDDTNFNLMNASSREKWIQGKPGIDGGMGLGNAGGGTSSTGRSF